MRARRAAVEDVGPVGDVSGVGGQPAGERRRGRRREAGELGAVHAPVDGVGEAGPRGSTSRPQSPGVSKGAPVTQKLWVWIRWWCRVARWASSSWSGIGLPKAARMRGRDALDADADDAGPAADHGGPVLGVGELHDGEAGVVEALPEPAESGQVEGVVAEELDAVAGVGAGAGDEACGVAARGGLAERGGAESAFEAAALAGDDPDDAVVAADVGGRSSRSTGRGWRAVRRRCA